MARRIDTLSARRRAAPPPRQSRVRRESREAHRDRERPPRLSWLPPTGQPVDLPYTAVRTRRQLHGGQQMPSVASNPVLSAELITGTEAAVAASPANPTHAQAARRLSGSRAHGSPNNRRLHLVMRTQSPKTVRATWISYLLRALGALRPLAAAAGRPTIDNKLHISPARLDRPTLCCLGVQLPFSGDANLNSSVTMQYRESGTTTWNTALPLWRVHPEVVTQETVSLNYAGSMFDLRADAAYDIQLTISDPDGIVDQNNNTLGPQTVVTLTARTRALPGDAKTPRPVSVLSSAGLTNALNAAQPGDTITIAPGTYHGHWLITKSGTADNPIVIRGMNTLDPNGNYIDTTILDGDNCGACNVLAVYGSYVHVEWLTIQNAVRALRSFNATTHAQTGTAGNVFRRLHTVNTAYGIGGASSGGAQTDFYIADNVLEGRIAWPTTCLIDSSCGSSSIDGIAIWGHGHVVAHNRLSGFGDAIANRMTGARANDFYGNDIRWNYDDGTELDGSEGNVRYFRNRISNSWEGISLQPINGGPAYIFRNIGINIQNEALKMHAQSRYEPSGYLAYNNTFFSNSYGHAWNNQASGTCHYFVIQNNLFQGPVPLTTNEVDVTCGQDHATIDYNGYSTDGSFAFVLNGKYTTFADFGSLQAGSGLEQNGQ